MTAARRFVLPGGSHKCQINSQCFVVYLPRTSEMSGPSQAVRGADSQQLAVPKRPSRRDLLHGGERRSSWYLYLYIYIQTHMCIYIHVYTQRHISIHTSTHVYTYIYIYTYLCVYIYAYIYICTSTYVHIYTYTYVSKFYSLKQL